MTTRTQEQPASTGLTPEPSSADYRRLQAEAMTLLGRDADTRLRLGELFEQMIRVKTPEEIAQDVDTSASGIKRMAAVWRFWREVRIEPTGSKRATYSLYDRVALDVLLTNEQRAAIRAAAPKGVQIVRDMLNDARGRALERLSSDTFEPDPQIFVHSAVLSLRRTGQHLEQLSTLSENDARLLNNQVAEIVKQITRLVGTTKKRSS